MYDSLIVHGRRCMHFLALLKCCSSLRNHWLFLFRISISFLISYQRWSFGATIRMLLPDKWFTVASNKVIKYTVGRNQIDKKKSKNIGSISRKNNAQYYSYHTSSQKFTEKGKNVEHWFSSCHSSREKKIAIIFRVGIVAFDELTGLWRVSIREYRISVPSREKCN